MVEGNSLHGTARITGVARMTIEKLLRDLGTACSQYQDEHLRNLSCRRIQCDEIWSFCYAKAKNVPPDRVGMFGYGDIWTWVALDADSKLVPMWLVGARDASTAFAFIDDLATRLRDRIQVTAEDHTVYLDAVENAFGSNVDYAMLVKLYGADPEPGTRYSPGTCIGCERKRIIGNPDPMQISTSYLERQNLTIRMSLRRFTRLTNAFSKKVENHVHAVALHFMHFNFARIHQTLRVTPAMAAGVTDHVWEVDEIVELLNRVSN